MRQAVWGQHRVGNHCDVCTLSSEPQECAVTFDTTGKTLDSLSDYTAAQWQQPEACE